MRPPCPACNNAMTESRVQCDGHKHPWFICICGAEVVLHNIVIADDPSPW